MDEGSTCDFCGGPLQPSQGVSYLNEVFCDARCRVLFTGELDRLLRKYEGTGLSPRDCMRAARSEFVIRAEPGIEKSVENEHLAAGDAIDQEIERLMAADEEQDQEWERLMAAAEEAEQIPEEVNIEPTEPRGRSRSTPTPPPPPRRRPGFWDTGTPYSAGGSAWKIVGWGIVIFTAISIVYVIATGDWTNSCRGTWWEC